LHSLRRLSIAGSNIILGDHSEESNSDNIDISSHSICNSEPDYDFVDNMDNKTLSELVSSDVNYNALCINYPDVRGPFELKSS